MDREDVRALSVCIAASAYPPLFVATLWRWLLGELQPFALSPSSAGNIDGGREVQRQVRLLLLSDPDVARAGLLASPWSDSVCVFDCKEHWLLYWAERIAAITALAQEQAA